jgi:superfamily II DNA helicase RecQ
MARLLQNPKFTKLVKRLHVDEAHNIYTAGTKKHGQEAFRPGWGLLREVRIRLSKGVPCQAVSATIPKHILDIVDKKLGLSSNRKLIRLSVNRPNITYAIHILVNGTNDFHNLDCIIPDNFHPPM